MSTIRSAAVLGASLAMGASALVAATPAHAAPACDTTLNAAQCSIELTQGETPELVYGSTSEDVKRVQQALNTLGMEVEPTGFFGPSTEVAVSDYQKSRGLKATGEMDQATWEALQQGKGTNAETGAVAEPVKAAVPVVAVNNAPKVQLQATVRLEAVEADIAAGGTGGPAQSFNPPPNASRAQIAVAFARAQVGKMYRYGGAGPDTFDCSGLTMSSWRAAGVSIPRTSQAQANGGARVSLSNIQPGDVIISNGGGHASIYVGGGQIIHAYQTGRPISYGGIPGGIVAIVRPGV